MLTHIMLTLVFGFLSMLCLFFMGIMANGSISSVDEENFSVAILSLLAVLTFLVSIVWAILAAFHLFPFPDQLLFG